MKLITPKFVAVCSLTVLAACLPEEEDYQSGGSSSYTSFPQGSCTYTTDTYSDLHYQWGVVEAAWDQYSSRQLDGTYSEQVGAYNLYVQHYNYYSDLIDTYKASGLLSSNWDCTPDQLAGV